MFIFVVMTFKQQSQTHVFGETLVRAKVWIKHKTLKKLLLKEIYFSDNFSSVLHSQYDLSGYPFYQNMTYQDITFTQDTSIFAEELTTD